MKEIEIILLIENYLILSDNYKPLKFEVENNFSLNDILNLLKNKDIIQSNSINSIIHANKLHNDVYIIVFSARNVLTSYAKNFYQIDYLGATQFHSNIVQNVKYYDFITLLFTEKVYQSFAQALLFKSKDDICKQTCEKIIEYLEDEIRTNFDIQIESPYLLEGYLYNNGFECDDIDYDYAYSKRFVHSDNYSYSVWVTLKEGNVSSYLTIDCY